MLLSGGNERVNLTFNLFYNTLGKHFAHQMRVEIVS